MSCFFVVWRVLVVSVYFFFFNDTATTEIYTLSLHDALPISAGRVVRGVVVALERHVPVAGPRLVLDPVQQRRAAHQLEALVDRKSTRLNSSHANISYAVFCLKKKKNFMIYNSQQKMKL